MSRTSPQVLIPNPDNARTQVLAREQKRLQSFVLLDIQRKYGAAAVYPLAYHGTSHTAEVVRRSIHCIAEMPAATCRPLMDSVPDEVTRFAIFVASLFHDIVNDGFIQETPFSLQQAERKVNRLLKYTGKNEEQSAEAAVAALQDLNARLGEELIPAGMIEQVRWAILATVPTFEDGTVVQPALQARNCTLIQVVTPYADLNGPGIFMSKHAPSAVLAREGSRIFRENNLFITQLLQGCRYLNAQWQPALEADDLRSLIDLMVGWLRNQATQFAPRRKEVFFEKDIYALGDQTQRNCITQRITQANFAAAMKHAEERQKMAETIATSNRTPDAKLADLLVMLGYRPDHNGRFSAL